MKCKGNEPRAFASIATCGSYQAIIVPSQPQLLLLEIEEEEPEIVEP